MGVSHSCAVPKPVDPPINPMHAPALCQACCRCRYVPLTAVLCLPLPATTAVLWPALPAGILADEMGLGKTIQTIALLAHLACEK